MNWANFKDVCDASNLYGLGCGMCFLIKGCECDVISNDASYPLPVQKYSIMADIVFNVLIRSHVVISCFFLGV